MTMTGSIFENPDLNPENFAWDVFFDGMPVPGALVDHEFRNNFNRRIYWNSEDEDRYRWSEERAEDEIDADDLVNAYKEVFDGESSRHSLEVFQRALEDQSIPENPRKVVEEALYVHEGVGDYREIIQNRHDTDNSINYERLLEPIKDKQYVSITEEGMEDLRSGEKNIRGGESLFFFLNTVDKNFQERVIPEVEQPEMNIEAYMEDGQLILNVYDNGPGVSSEEVERLFKPKEGNGTGLPVTEYIIDEYRGEIDFYRPETEGFGLEARFDVLES